MKDVLTINNLLALLAFLNASIPLLKSLYNKEPDWLKKNIFTSSLALAILVGTIIINSSEKKSNENDKLSLSQNIKTIQAKLDTAKGKSDTAISLLKTLANKNNLSDSDRKKIKNFLRDPTGYSVVTNHELEPTLSSSQLRQLIDTIRYYKKKYPINNNTGVTYAQTINSNSRKIIVQIDSMLQKNGFSLFEGPKYYDNRKLKGWKYIVDSAQRPPGTTDLYGSSYFYNFKLVFGEF